MIGAVTMSRVVTDPGLSAEILSAAEKSLAAGVDLSRPMAVTRTVQ